MQESIALLAPGTPIGDYEVTGTLGRGGMGTVYAGIHPIIGKRVAIKCLNERFAPDSDSLRLFVNEARAVNAIGHPGIIDIFNIGQLSDGRPYLVMELVDGETLADRMLDRDAPLAFGEICSILEAILDALEAAHAKGFVHRDLKPENVMLLGARGAAAKVKLLDFGIAKLTRADGTSVATSNAIPVGTPSYMAPEQCLCEGVDARTDLYSLGVMMFLLFTRRLPFVAEASYRVLEGHVSQPPPLPSVYVQLPPALEELILDCLEKTRERRPASAGEVRERLRAIAARHPHGDKPLADRPPRRARRLMWAGATVALLVTAGIAVGLRAARTSPSAPTTAAPVIETPSPAPIAAPIAAAPAPPPPAPVAPSPAPATLAPAPPAVAHAASKHHAPPHRAAAPTAKRPALDDIGDFPQR
jgi:serine/threonine-protein kinase